MDSIVALGLVGDDAVKQAAAVAYTSCVWDPRLAKSNHTLDLEISSDMLLRGFKIGRHLHCLQCIAVPPSPCFAPAAMKSAAMYPGRLFIMRSSAR